MILNYFTNETLDDLKVNFETYKSHYMDEDNEWFIKHFEKSKGLLPSKIECNDFEMCYDEDFNISDYKNVKVIYENLMHLTPSQATDERLWSGLLHSQFWEYVKYRRKVEIESGKSQDIQNSFFFMRGKKRSLYINCLSRLWWTGYMTYDETLENHYELTKLVCQNAFASNIMLLSSSNLTGNKNNILGILRSIKRRQDAGEVIKREHFVGATKYLNNMGAVTILDILGREDIEEIINGYYEDYFGKL